MRFNLSIPFGKIFFLFNKNHYSFCDSPYMPKSDVVFIEVTQNKNGAVACSPLFTFLTVTTPAWISSSPKNNTNGIPNLSAYPILALNFFFSV